MVFKLEKLYHLSGEGNMGGDQIFAYVDADHTLAEITASGFFSPAVEQLQLNDWIQVTGSDGSGLVRVNSIAPSVVDVTDAQRIGAPAGRRWNIVYFAQSLGDRVHLHDQNPAFHDVANAPPVASDTSLTVYTRELYGGGEAQVLVNQVTQANPVSKHLAHLSNMLAAVAPQDEFHIAFVTKASEDVGDLLNDGGTWDWQDGLDIVNVAFNNAGHAIDFGIQCWSTSDASVLDLDYGAAWFEAWTGLQFADGVTPSARFNHFFPEMVGANVPLTICTQNFNQLTGFDTVAGVWNSIDAMVASAVNQASGLITRGVNIDFESSVTDQSHQMTAGDFGITRYAQMLGYQILLNSGRLTVAQPELELESWDASRAVFYSPAGAITTLRAELSEAVPAGQPDVFGFVLNGFLPVAASMALVNGKIELTGAFAAGELLEFGRSRFGNLDTQDFTDQTFKQKPGVVVPEVLGQLQLVNVGRPKSWRCQISNPGPVFANSVVATDISAAPWGAAVDADGWTLNLATRLDADTNSGDFPVQSGDTTFTVDIRMRRGKTPILFQVYINDIGGLGGTQGGINKVGGDCHVSTPAGTGSIVRIAHDVYRYYVTLTLAGTRQQYFIPFIPNDYGVDFRNPSVIPGALTPAEVRALDIPA